MSQPTQGNVNLPTETAREVLTVRRVFGEAYERDGVTVIPVAKVMGGSGMGFGSGAMGKGRPGAGEEQPAGGEHAGHKRPGAGEGSGGGGGFGVRARPVGVYIVKDGKVSWQPALDLNRVILGGQIFATVAVLALSRALRRRRFTRR
ncbi:spore germination protein GerW family protein [Georgenia ruanii]|uniref:Sporulation protein n=1 Tax=Georgenia ruanii TaxID=348442 RepID=A0A7J9UU58_9MICO|nr:spore germination protein GerW family protein [Georgenia ruanii]MPV88146.1 sporulation protein [Georgenia ruanii]